MDRRKYATAIDNDNIDELLIDYDDDEDLGATYSNDGLCSILAIPKTLLQAASLTYTERLVLSYIGAHKNGCYRRQTTVAENLGITRMSVYSTLCSLENKGLLECKLEKNKETFYAAFKTSEKKMQIFQVQNDILRLATKTMSPKDKFVLAIIVRFIEKDLAFSYQHIGDILGCRRSGVLNSIEKLQKSPSAVVRNMVKVYLKCRKNYP